MIQGPRLPCAAKAVFLLFGGVVAPLLAGLGLFGLGDIREVAESRLAREAPLAEAMLAVGLPGGSSQESLSAPSAAGLSLRRAVDGAKRGPSRRPSPPGCPHPPVGAIGAQAAPTGDGHGCEPLPRRDARPLARCLSVLRPPGEGCAQPGSVGDGQKTEQSVDRQR